MLDFPQVTTNHRKSLPHGTVAPGVAYHHKTNQFVLLPDRALPGKPAKSDALCALEDRRRETISLEKQILLR